MEAMEDGGVDEEEGGHHLPLPPMSTAEHSGTIPTITDPHHRHQFTSSSKISAFVRSPLVTWVRSLSLDDDDEEEQDEDEQEDQDEGIFCRKLADGPFLQRVWQKISGSNGNEAATPTKMHQVNRESNETIIRLNSLSTLLTSLSTFYAEALGQLIILRPPDIVAIARRPEDHLDDLLHLLLLFLGSAVQCDGKEAFIEGIKRLDLSIQHSIVEAIQEITDNPNAVWPSTDPPSLGELPEEEVVRLFALLRSHLHRLAKQRDELICKLVSLALEVEALKAPLTYEGSSSSTLTTPNSPTSLTSSGICCSSSSSGSGIEHRRGGGHNQSSNSPAPSPLSSPIGGSGADHQTQSHLLVELADAKGKLRRMGAELEEKKEMVMELREMMEQAKESGVRLRNENLELVQEARAAKAYRDEVDILTERVRKVDRLEAEVVRYRDKMNELDFYKSRVEEIREDNRILSETKSMLEDQLNSSKKRADLVPDMEGQLVQLRAYASELALERDMERDRTVNLLEEVTQGQVEKKAIGKELAEVQGELNHLRSQLSESIPMENGEVSGNLLEQLNNDSAKRILKLELENQKLNSLVENMKNSRADLITSSLNNNVNSVDNFVPGIGSGGLLDKSTPPLVDSELDSGVGELVSELNVKLEKVEKENEMLKEAAERLKEFEEKNVELERSKTCLELEVDQLKGRLSSEQSKLELLKRSVSNQSAENQRVSRQCEGLQKRLEEAQSELVTVESENGKLQMTAMSLKSTTKRLNDLEKEVTTLEADHHRVEQEKRCLEKEIMRLKSSMEEKDSLLDDYSGRSTNLELDKKQLRKELESMNNQLIHLKELESERKEMSGELAVCKRSLDALRADLVQEKIIGQQLNSDLERVYSTLQKIALKSEACTEAFSSCTVKNSEWSSAKCLEQLIDGILKKLLGSKSSQIGALEDEIKFLEAKNQHLVDELAAVKNNKESNDETYERKMIDDMEAKIISNDEEIRSLKSNIKQLKESESTYKSQIRSLEARLETVSRQASTLQSESAKASVETSVLRAENTSLNSEINEIRIQSRSGEELRQEAEMKLSNMQESYASLAGDNEALQKLHQQLTQDYDSLSKNCAQLKQVHKELRTEHRVVQEKLQAWMLSKEELEKFDNSNEFGGPHCGCLSSQDLNTARSEIMGLRQEKARIETELKMIQNIYRNVRTENNELKLRHAELRGEANESQDRIGSLEADLSKMSSYCGTICSSNNYLEEQRQSLIRYMTDLVNEYETFFKEVPSEGGATAYTQRLQELSSQRVKFDRLVKEFEALAEKKRVVAVSLPQVSNKMMPKLPKSATGESLNLISRRNLNGNLNSVNNNFVQNNRHSCPPIEEGRGHIYGKIWESGTGYGPNTAAIRPMMNSSSGSELSDDHSNQVILVMNEDEKKVGNISPPRPPPRVAATLENRTTINAAPEANINYTTTQQLQSTHRHHHLAGGASSDIEESEQSEILRSAANSLYANPNFARGTFRSASLSFGSPIRRNMSGHHHHHHHLVHLHHHHQVHSATPSVNSDSPQEEPDLSDGTFGGVVRRGRNGGGIVNVMNGNRKAGGEGGTAISQMNGEAVEDDTRSVVTNSVWYEYGCV